MRTLRFRGKAKATNKWVYGDLRQFPNGKCAIYTDDSDNPLSCPIVDAKTVGQYTGLHDVNGKEIYEGDILAGANGLNHLVAYYEHEASFKAICSNSYLTISNIWIKGCMLRVIGNIYDNPEQLSKTK